MERTTQIALNIFKVEEIKILEGTCLQNKLDISALKLAPGGCLSPEPSWQEQETSRVWGQWDKSSSRRCLHDPTRWSTASVSAQALTFSIPDLWCPPIHGGMPPSS